MSGMCERQNRLKNIKDEKASENHWYTSDTSIKSLTDLLKAMINFAKDLN